MLTIEGMVSLEMYRNLIPVYTEYNVGNYFRQFVVNQDIDASRIEARIRNGVLEVSLPKAEGDDGPNNDFDKGQPESASTDAPPPPYA